MGRVKTTLEWVGAVISIIIVTQYTKWEMAIEIKPSLIKMTQKFFYYNFFQERKNFKF